MIRNTTAADMDRLEEIYAGARQRMRESGNPNQWKNSSPAHELLEQDLAEGNGYVIEEDGEIIGTFACIPGDDPTYAYIEDGAWLSDAPYCTIHRIAGDGIHKGTMRKAVEFALSKCPHLRIDTHEDNKIMQHVILKNGFVRTGIIYLKNGEPRIAFERV